MIFFADITILVFSYFLISRSSSAPKNPVSGCILYCMSLCLHWKPPSGFYSSMIALVPPALKAFYLSDNTMCSASLWQPLHPSTHKSPHPVISPSHLKSIYQKKRSHNSERLTWGATSAPALFTAMSSRSIVLLGAFEMRRVGFFLCGAFVNATAAVAQIWAPLMSFSPVLQKIPAICKVIWWIGMLPTESAQCANEWCWLSTQHMDAMYLFRIYSLVSCQWRQIYLHPSSVPSPLVQVWHFTALPAVDVLNVFCMWNYFCEAVHLCRPRHPSRVPPPRPLFHSWRIGGGTCRKSTPVLSSAEREREMRSRFYVAARKCPHHFS